jgi:hypothetical protein
MDFREMGLGCTDWIDLAPNRDQWLSLVNTVMKLQVLLKQWEILEWLSGWLLFKKGPTPWSLLVS